MIKTNYLLPIYALTHREVVRFFRQRSRWIGAFLQPLIFLILFGAGFRSIFQLEINGQSISYFEFFLPGVLVLMVLFTAIFSTISVIEDRKEGFLQTVLVSPISRLSIVGGKIIGSTILSLIQAMIILLFALIYGYSFSIEQWLSMFLVLIFLGISLSAVGYIIAWVVSSTQGFHAIMNALLVPMWLLSGAFFPLEGTPIVMEWLMKLNPLTYGMNLMRFAFYFSIEDAHLFSFYLSLFVFGLFCCCAVFWAYYITIKRPTGKLH